MNAGKRSFLFLQGLATPFFWSLAREIMARGHDAHRVNICAGDRLFWPMHSATDFRGREKAWPGFIARLMQERNVTDLLLFGDCRPYHESALKAARGMGISVHVFEEGYFRPHWITMERNGTNALSRLPRDRAAIVAADPGLEDEAQVVGGGFARRVWWECLSQVTTLAFKPLYPGYRRHRPYHPATEVAGWISRLARRPWERGYAEKVTAFLAGGPEKFFVFPLQLQSDYQIRRHSPFRDLKQAMELVLRSFAEHAPRDSRLLIKVHPLDNGLNNYRRRVIKLSRELGLLDRVFIVDGGHLPTMLEGCSGVVVVNSTVGLSAIHHERPVKVLGTAIFDIPGLTFQASLDRFWRGGTAPDQALYRAFRRVILQKAQLNGSFFSKDGMPLAVRGVIDRLGVRVLEPRTAGARGIDQSVRAGSLPIANG